MAILHDFRNEPDEQGLSLEITPVWPDLQGPEDEYDVRFACDEEVIHRRYHVRDFDTGHSLMTQLAHAFIKADRLTQRRWDFRLSDRDIGTDKYNPTQCLYFNHYWFRVAMWELSFKEKPLLHIHAYLKKDWPDPSSPRAFPECYFTMLYCTVEEAVRFGTQLLQECYDAARRRAELGLYASCDADVFGFVPIPEFDVETEPE